MRRTMGLLYFAMLACACGLQLVFGARFADLWQGDAVWGAGGLPMDIGIGVAVGLLTVGLNRITSRLFAWSQTTEREFRSMLAPLAPRDVFGVALMSSVAEEVLFRGFLQPRFGLGLTSVVFGLVHLPDRRSLLPWTLAATLMGFVLGGLYLLRGSLVAPILVHFLVNFFNMHHLLSAREGAQ